MEKMQKTDFEIKVNGQNGEMYVIKIKDELTENHIKTWKI